MHKSKRPHPVVQGCMDFFGIVRDVIMYGIPGLFRLAYSQVAPAVRWAREGVELQDKATGKTWISRNPMDMLAYVQDGLRTGMKYPSELTWIISNNPRNSWYFESR